MDATPSFFNSLDRESLSESSCGEKCFSHFDKNSDGFLDKDEFKALLDDLFRDGSGKSYETVAKVSQDIFEVFDTSKGGLMTMDDFKFCWSEWIKKILHPVNCLIIVDVQNDFISGSLALTNCPAGDDGGSVVEPINKVLDTEKFDLVCYSCDWHPSDHVSFVENVHLRKLDASSPIQDPSQAKVFDTVVFEGPPTMEQKLWPAHAVQGTWGSELHKDLKVIPEGKIVHKGINSNVDSYSAFFDNKKLGFTELESILRQHGVTDAYVCGLALDLCVGYTARHAQELGFRTAIVRDLSCRITPEGAQTALDRITDNHGLIVNSSELKPMLDGSDRRPEPGLFLALEVAKLMGQQKQA